MRRLTPVVLMLLWCGLPVLPQIGGPYPGGYPPGGYPPGYPGGRGSIGGPGLPRLPGRNKQKKTTTSKETPEPLINLTGTLRKIDNSSVVIQAQDTRLITLKRTEKTKFFNGSVETKPDDLKRGDELLVEAKQNDEGYLYAVNVIIQKRATAEQPAAEAAPVEAPTPDEEPTPGAAPPKIRTLSEDEDGRPRLRRGWSKNQKTSLPEEAEPTAPAAPAGRRPAPAPAAETVVDTAAGTVIEAASDTVADPTIEKARAVATAFTEKLPNYVCQEHIARFVTTSHTTNWQPLDLVSAEVVYEDGREHYRNVMLKGKPTSKGMEDLPGAWSTGEFGTMLVDLFSPSTRASFELRGESKSSGQPALMYDFEVDQENSHWTVSVPSQTVRPAYRGSIWIDKTRHNVLRIEMQARRLPREFPLDKVESAVDYQYVRFGEGQFLLPVHAETLACQRGTSMCSRNNIDFRNYHKYTSESNIIFNPK